MLAVAMLLAAGIRLYLFWQYFCISSDGVRYIEAAQDFYAINISSGLSSVYPPLYPLMIAALFPLVGDWEWTGQTLSMVAGVVVLVPLFLLFRKIYGEGLALVACFLAAIAPSLARYSAHVRTEATFVLLSTEALLLFHAGIENRFWRDFFYGGLIAGLAYLVRPEGIGFLVIIPIALLIEWWFGRTFSLRQVLIGSLLTMLGFLLFAGSYVAYLAIDTGDWGAISRKTNLAIWYGFRDSGLLDDDQLAAIVAPGAPGIVEFFLAHPFAYVKKILLDIPVSVGVYFEVVYYSYVPFLLLGIYHAVRRKFWDRSDLLLFIVVVFYIVGFASLYVNSRYAIQLIPASLGWVAMGLIWSVNYDHFRRFLSLKAFNMTAIVIGLAFMGATLGKTLQPISLDKAYIRDAGRYLKKMNGDGKLKVAVRDSRVSFYAGAQAVDLFKVKESALRSYLQEHKPQYLAAETKYWRRDFPNAAERPADFGLHLDREFIGSRQDRLLVFKVDLKA